MHQPFVDQLTPGVKHRSFALLSVAALSMSAPYALSGPGFFMDDWFALRAARLDGWYLAAGADQWRARPGAGATYALTFGLLHDRPAAHFAIAVALLLVASGLLLVVVTRMSGSRTIGLVVSIVWLASPNHTSLEMWPSALNILLALVLLLAGAELATRSDTSYRSDVASSLVLGIGVLTYEAVAPAAVVLVVATAVWRRAGRRRWVLLTAGVGVQVLCLGWIGLNWHPAKRSVAQWIAPERVVTGNLADGVFGDWLPGQVFGTFVLIVLVWVLARRLRKGKWADARSQTLFVAGTAIVVLGAVPFVRYFYAPIGFGDRVTVVSGVGGACLLVGIGLESRSLAPRAARLGSVVAVLIAVGWRMEMVSTYSAAADDGRRVIEAVRERFPEAPEDPLVFGPHPVLEDNVGAFLQLDWPMQWLYGTDEVTAITTSTEEEFEAAEPSRRFDLVRLSRLQDDERQ